MPYCIKPMLYDRLQRASLAVGVLLHDYYCCNLPVCVAFSVQFTTSGMCARNNTHIYVARTNSNRVISFVISIFACCHSVKLCALAARIYRLQHYLMLRAVGTAPRTPRPGGPQPCLGAPPQLQYFYCITFLILKIIIYISMIKCHGQLAGTGGGHQLNHPRHFVLYQGLL